MDDSPLGYYSTINSDDTDLRLFAERIKLVYSHANVVISASLLAVVIVLFIFWGEISNDRLIIWSVLVAITCFAGYLQIVRFSRARSRIENMTPWKFRFLATTFVMGALWGWATVYLPPPDSKIHQVFLILLSGCLAAGSVATFSAVIESIFMFSIPAMAPVAGVMISSGNEIEATMGYVTLLYVMFLVSLSRRINGVVCSTLKLRYENMDLVNNMQRSVLELSMAKDSLVKSEDRFRHLAEASFEGVIIIENGFIIDFNLALLQTTGYSAEQLGGKRLLDLVVPDYHALIKRRLTEEQSGPVEILLKTKNGSALPVEVRVKSANYKGAAIRVIAIRDIRERKKTEKSLLEAKTRAEEATRLKDMFVSMVAHDLKSPINSIMSLLKMQRDGDEATKAMANRPETIDSVLESGSRMVDIIDELLNLSRLQTGKIIPCSRFIKCAELADITLAGFSHIATRKGITLNNQIDNGNMVFTDADLLGQVMRNLVSNAIKFCGPADTISISSPKNQSVVIVISDTGPGIREDILVDVFRYDKNISTMGSGGERGTGLGLPFSKDIMEALGGAISIKTSKEGTSLYLHLPNRKPKILLVDDDQAVLDLCRRKLENLDVDIVETCDGAEALKIIDDDTLDLVVSDIMMPGVDGFQILHATRNNVKTSAVPVIIITGEQGDDVRRKALSMGASEFILKHDPSRDLLDIVKRRIFR